MDREEYEDFIENIASFSEKDRVEKIYQASRWMKMAVWESVKEDFEKVLKSGNKREVLSAMFKDEEGFQYIWNWLDIPENLKWGLEIETSTLSLDKIRYFFRRNLIGDIADYLRIPKNISNRIIKNHAFEANNQFAKWNFTREAGYDESEASSPIFKNDLVNLNEISAMCTILKALGGHTGFATGLHINVGVDYFECNRKALNNLLKIWGESEEILYKIANPQGNVIRKMAGHLAVPVQGNVQQFLEKDGSIKLRTREEMEKFVLQIQGGYRLDDVVKGDEEIRWTSINFSHMGLRLKNPGRIEIRMFNSSLQPEVIFEDLLLVGKLFEVSLKTAKEPDYKKQEFKNLLRRDISEKEKVDRLLNLLFDKESQKEIFRKRWESIKDNPEYKKYRSGEDTFLR